MAVTKYTHSLATDFGGSFLTANWIAEIHAQGSGITVQVDHVDTSGDVIDTYMKDVLPGGKADLDALTGSHSSTPAADVSHVQTDLEVGGLKTDTDGVSMSLGASSFSEACYQMPEGLHVQGTVIGWQGFSAGDYGWLVVINPAGTGAIGAQADSGQANVTVASGKGAYYDPANGAAYLEIWDNSDVLKEVRKIASVSGDVVTLDSNLQGTYDTSHKSKVRVDGFSPVRGSHGISGGFHLVGSGTQRIKNETGVTEAIPAGLHLCARVFTGAAAGTRDLALSFLFRKPLA